MYEFLASITIEKVIVLIAVFAILWMAIRTYPAVYDFVFKGSFQLVSLFMIAPWTVDTGMYHSWANLVGWLLIAVFFTNLFQIANRTGLLLFIPRLQTRRALEIKAYLSKNNQFTREELQQMLDETNTALKNPWIMLWPAHAWEALARKVVSENMIRTYDQTPEFRKPYVTQSTDL